MAPTCTLIYVVRPLWRRSGPFQTLRFTQSRYSSKKSSKAAKARKAIQQFQAPVQRPSPPKATPQPKSQTAKAERKASLAETLNLVPKKVVETTIKAMKAPPKPAPSAPAGEYWAIDSALAGAGRTLLYKRSSSLLTLGCYSLAAACIFFGARNYEVVTTEVEGVPSWVLYTHSFAVAVYGGLVIFLVAKPSRIIRAIHSVPFRPTPEARPTVKLEFTCNNFLPFLPPRRFQSFLSDVHLGRQVYTEPKPVVEIEPPRNIIQKVARGASQRSFGVFTNLRDAITREHTVPVYFKGGLWAMSINATGWQWEKKGLDRLIGMSP